MNNKNIKDNIEETARNRKVQRRKRKTEKILRSVPFFICLFGISVLAWMLPLRPTVSYSENRNLAKFPEFSLKELISGDYFGKIDYWFSDTFTFRDSWMELGESIASLYGYSDVALVGELTHNDNLNVINTVPVVEHEPAPAITGEPQLHDSATGTEQAGEVQTDDGAVQSDEPNVVSVAADEEQNTGAEDIIAGDDLTETENPDTQEETIAEAAEEQWNVDLDDINLDEALAFNGSVVIIDGSAYPITRASESHSSMFIETVNHTADILDGKARLFVSFPVQSSTALLSRDLREYFGCAIDEDTIEYLTSQFDDRVIPVNMAPALQAHNNEYIYFHSDHHWTALGAYYAYTAWAEAAGVEPVPLSEYEEVNTGGFTGTYYTYNSKSHPIDTDEVYYYNPPGDIHLYICDKGMGDSKEYLGFEQRLKTNIAGNGAGKYSVFLAGDHAMCTLVNNDIEDESAVLIYKDSYGNPLAYYFTQHYKYVYLLDYRYYSNRNMSYFVDYYNVDDVIIAINMYQTQSDAGNLYFRAFTRNAK